MKKIDILVVILCFLVSNGISQECSSVGVLSSFRSEYPSADPAGPYCPGETVTFCYDLEYNVDPQGTGNSCSWLHGIVPVLGCGWDLTINDIADQVPEDSEWWPEGSVDYNIDNLDVDHAFDCCGKLSLEYPSANVNMGTLSEGDLLPGGFWFISNGIDSCTNDGDPDNSWGYEFPCGEILFLSHCFNLTVKNHTILADCDACNSDLKVDIFTFSDNETGCYGGEVCNDNVMHATFDGVLDCSSFVTVDIVSSDTEICNGATTNLELETNDTNYSIVVQSENNPNILGATINDTFPNGVVTISDVLINTGTSPEIITYEFYATHPNLNSICNGQMFTSQITVNPTIQIEFDEPYTLCWDGQEEIVPTISGGSGIYSDYNWSNGDIGPSTIAPENPGDSPGDYQYALTVSDDTGCTAEATVDYTIRDQVILTLNTTSSAACVNGINDNEEICAEIVAGASNGPFTYSYNFDSNLMATIDEDCIIINEENSAPGEYDIFLEVEDQFGCVYAEGPVVFTVEDDLLIDFNPVICSTNSNNEVLYSFEVCSDINSGVEWYLFDENCGTQLDGPLNSSCETFTVQPFESGDVLPAIFCVQLINTSTNCTTNSSITIPAPILPDIPLSLEGCAGETTTITLGNSEEFTSWTWCDGVSDEVNFSITFEEDELCVFSVTDNSNCELTYEIIIEVFESIDAEITGSTSFCAGSNTTLCANSDPSYSYIWSTGETSECIDVSDAGNYSVDISNDNCSASANVDISVGANLNPIINGGDFCSGQSVLLSTGNNFTSYEWTDSDGNIVQPINPTSPWEIEVGVAGEYTVEVSDGSCDGITMFLVNESMEATAQLTSGSICNSGDSGDETILDLESLITSVNGAFTIQDQNGATVNPIIIDFEGVSAGTINYTVVVEGTEPCPDVPFILIVEVVDCGCPEVELNAIPDFCNDQENLIELNNFLGQFTATNGEFVVLNSEGNMATFQTDNNNTLVIEEGTEAGIYTVNYDLQNIPIGCISTANAIIEIFDAPTLSGMNGGPICNSSASGEETTIDIQTLIDYNGDGDWFDENSMLLTSTLLDVDGFVPGQYLFTFITTDAEAPCDNQNVEIEIMVVDCDCPTLAFNSSIESLCETDGAIDLNDLLADGTDDGVWSTSAPSGLSGSIFNPQGLDAEIYTFDYELTNPLVGCPDIISMDIEVILQSNAGEQFSEYIVCEFDEETIDLFDELTSADEGGFFQEISNVPSTGSAFNQSNQTFDPSNQIPGEYSFEYIIEASVVCMDVAAIVTIIIEDNPIADAGADAVIFCGVSSVTIGGSDSSQGGNYEYTWENDLGEIIYQGSELNYEANSAGTYTLIVMDNTLGCSSSDEIEITVDMNTPNIFYSTINVSCFGDSDGVILIDSIIGGLAPYQLSIDGNNFNEVESFENLSAGFYDLIIIDSNMCEVNVSEIQISESEFFTAEVGPDIEDEVGEEITLSVNLANLDLIDEITWTANGEVICSNNIIECLDYGIVVPMLETEFCVSVIDTLGCEAVDCLLVSGLGQESGDEIIVDDILSPNDDGFNDNFEINGFEDNLAINHPKNKIIIFNRWGQAIYEASPYDNDWEGDYNGESGRLVPQGTYYYQFDFVDKPEGITHSLRLGSITLIR